MAADGAECYGVCGACGKKLYASRRAARRAARRLHPGERLSPYVCTEGGRGFHFGHLGEDVITGRATRSEVYGGRRR